MTTVAQVPQIHFAKPEITDDDVQAVVSVLRSGWLTTGSVAREFEDALAGFLGVEHVVATSSCTTALECALAHLRLPAGSRVAVPAWTFVSTVSVPLRLGLVPVLVDADPNTLNMSVESLAAVLDRGVSAVVPVHFAGNPVTPQVFRLASRYGVWVIEDSAHALGARLAPRRPSLASCYSFYATKNLTSGEGGAMTTNDADLADFARAYRLHGMSHDAWRRYGPGGAPTYDLVNRGIKANFPDLLAALALSQLRRFDQMQARRRAIVCAYRDQLKVLPDITCVPAELDTDSADHLMVVLLPDKTDRASVVSYMAGCGVTTSVHFRPVHHFPALHGSLDIAGGLTICDRSWPRALSLPLHPTMTPEDVSRVVTCLRDALRRPAVN